MAPTSVLSSVHRDFSTGPGKYNVIAFLKGPEMAIMLHRQHQLRHHRKTMEQRMRGKSRWPWSLSPREDARVPGPHEAETPISPELRSLTERTATLYWQNQKLQRSLAALQAETNAVLSAIKKPSSTAASSMGVLSPPSTPESRPSLSSSAMPRPPSSLPSSPTLSSPPSSPASLCSSSPDSDCDELFSSGC